MEDATMENAAMRDRDCHLTDEELLLGLDHELPAPEQSLVDAHLAQCGACQRRFALIDRTSQTLRRSIERTP